jgi:hypothetical protein
MIRVGSRSRTVRKRVRKRGLWWRKNPETALLCQVEGVGSLTALTFVLTLGDHRLWVTAEVYDPLYNTRRRGGLAA